MIAFIATAAAMPMLTPLFACPYRLRFPIPSRRTSGRWRFVELRVLSLVRFRVCRGHCRSRARRNDVATRRPAANTWIFIVGSTIAVTAFAASHQPSLPALQLLAHVPEVLFIRARGLLIAAIGAAYAWHHVRGACRSGARSVQMGRSSLFIYWIHVEMVYGLISLPLHNALTLPQSLLLFAVFSVFMLGCSMAKERVQKGFRRFREGSDRVQGSERSRVQKVRSLLNL